MEAKLIKLLILSLVLISINVIAFERLTPDFTSNYSPNLSETEGGLWMVMGDVENQLKNSPAVIKDPDVNNYMNEIICKLTNKYCNNLRIYIVRNPFFNASMAPNGMMQVHTGLILRARNEAQLATVLGHEAGHYLKRHTVKFYEDVSTKSSFLAFFSLGMMGAVGFGNMNPDAGRGVLEITNLALTGSIFAYSRDNEREADKFGIQLLGDANLDVYEAKKIWLNLSKEKEAAGEDINAGAIFYATHPDPGERIINLDKYAKELSAIEKMSYDKNKDIYWSKIKPLLPTLLEDQLNLRQFDETEYLFTSLLKDNIYPGIMHFYLGELYRLEEDEDKKHLVIEHYKKSVSYDDHPPEVHRSLGIIEYKKRNHIKANNHFKEYLIRNPDANDREMIEFYMSSGA